MTIAHFKQLDWDFREQNSRKFLHNLCWYPSRFIPIIPAQIISALSNPGDLVVDPFCGSGTVLLEAMRLDRRSICIDINPLGCFIASTKARIFSGEPFDLRALEILLTDLKEVTEKNITPKLFATKSRLLNQEDNIPNKKEVSLWYHEKTLKELSALYNYIEKVNDELSRDVLRLIFISILMTSSGHKGGRPYTYYADNVKPKAPLEKNAFKTYYQKLKRFIVEYKQKYPFDKINLSWDVLNEDARNITEKVTGPIDLIITSPPYVGVTDYNMGFRLAHLWYEWEKPLDTLKKNEIGARWMRKHKDLSSKYLSDINTCFSNMSKCLNTGKYLCIVIGESKKHYETINNNIISFLEETQGLKLIHTSSREINQKFFIHPSGGVKTEDILVFKKE